MKVLVPLDGSPLAERVLPYAAAFARADGVSLVLTHIRPVYTPPREAMSAVEAAAERLRERGFVVDTLEYDQFVGSVGEVIVAAAHDQQADLIAMTTHGRSGVSRWVYGSVADEVIRASDLPVLVIPAVCERVWEQTGPRKILVTLDGSELAETALGPARALAEKTGASLILLRVVEPPNYVLYADAPAVYPSDEPERELAEARSYVERMAESLGRGLVADARAEVGTPVLTIDATARAHDIDLIAMATHGRGGLARLALGSIATGMLQRSNVPLLFVRPAAMRRAKTARAGESTESA